MKAAVNRRRCLQLSLGMAAGLAAPTAAGAPPLQWQERALLGFGTTLWLRAAHADVGRAARGLDAAVAAIRHVQAQMSLFDPDSALSRLNRDGVLHEPHPDLVRVLTLAHQVAAASRGAFDVTVQPLWALWQHAQRSARVPTEGELVQARSLVDWRGVELTAQRIRLRRPGMALTLNGIAQGYAADLARASLQAQGIEHALLDTGEWSALGRGPNDAPWTLGLADPRRPAATLARLRIGPLAVATSSDAHTAFSADLRHHHILDPRTGDSPPGLASVTVAAASCALADALTKVLFMGGWDNAMKLARRWKVEVLVVDKAGRWQASSDVFAGQAGHRASG